jgi:hypothetical protein
MSGAIFSYDDVHLSAEMYSGRRVLVMRQAGSVIRIPYKQSDVPVIARNLYAVTDLPVPDLPPVLDEAEVQALADVIGGCRGIVLDDADEHRRAQRRRPDVPAPAAVGGARHGTGRGNRGRGRRDGRGH